MIRTVVADDVDLAREGIIARLEHAPDIKVVGEACDGPTAIDCITRIRPDLVFLDVELPGCNGFEVLCRIPPSIRPYVVFVTGHDRYAVDAFSVQAVDYLLKPFSDTRFDEALARASQAILRRRLLETAATPSLPSRLTVRDRHKLTIIKTEQIDWIRTDENYSVLHIAKGRVVQMRSTLRDLERLLDPRSFVRIHRQVIVNIERVSDVLLPSNSEASVILTDGTKLPVGRHYRGLLAARFVPPGRAISG